MAVVYLIHRESGLGLAAVYEGFHRHVRALLTASDEGGAGVGVQILAAKEP